MAQNVRLNLAEALLSEVSDPNFLPCPKISLYADPKSLGACGICQVTGLKFRSESSGSSVTILPCGHIGCQRCIQKSLRSKPQCPYCRLSLKYELCVHPLEGRVITKENLFAIPDTLPMGGAIPDQCRDCRTKTNRVANEDILKSLSSSFGKLREKYQTAGNQAKGEIRPKMLLMQQHFQIVTEKLSVQNTAALTVQW